MYLDEEIWIRSPRFDFLSVSTHGRILLDSYEIQMPNGGVKKISPSPHLGVKSKANKKSKHERYLFFNVKRGIRNVKVHQLIAEAFHGPKPFEDSVVMHLDDNPLNNHYLNLRWGSQKENLNTDSFIAYARESAPWKFKRI